MKIVRIIARLNVGGPARHVVWLDQALRDAEFSSILITGRVPEGEEDMSYFAAAHGVEPIYIEEMSRELSPKDAVSLWKVFQRLRREQPDVVHTHTAKAGTIGRAAGFLYKWLTPGALVGKPRRVQFVHTYHGHVFHSYYGKNKTRFFLFVEKTLARLATDRILVLSEQQRREIHEEFGVGRAAQFRIVPLGIDLNAFREWREKRDCLRLEIDAGADEILVGLVGRLTEIKNHGLFLRTARVYKERRADDAPKIRFLIIGDGHLRKSLEKEAARLGVSDVVHFLGNRNDTDIIYAGLDIVALTSLNEGTPLSLIEAMANARPAVSTAVGGVVDLLGAPIDETENFVLCERGVRVRKHEPEAFFEGLNRLAADEKLRIETGARGAEFVFSRYSKERLVEDIKNLYRELAEMKT